MWTLWIASALAEDLTVQVVGLPADTGVVVCALYAEQGRWLQEGGAAREVKATPRGGRASCVFRGLAQGEYAVALFQDVNGSGGMDYTFGLPTEPWGISRDASVITGRPRWGDAVFSVPGALQVVSVR